MKKSATSRKAKSEKSAAKTVTRRGRAKTNASNRPKKAGSRVAKKGPGRKVMTLAPAGALATVRLAMPSGPETLVTTGDVYRKAVSNDPKVAPNVTLKRTRVADLSLAAGRYYYAFDVRYGTGDFTLDCSQGGAVTSKKSYTNAPSSGNVFDFAVT